MGREDHEGPAAQKSATGGKGAATAAAAAGDVEVAALGVRGLAAAASERSAAAVAGQQADDADNAHMRKMAKTLASHLVKGALQLDVEGEDEQWAARALQQLREEWIGRGSDV